MSQAAASGNYLGIRTTPEADFGEYLRLSDSGNAFYDGVRWIRVCEVTRDHGVTSFETAPMFGRVFAFRGTSQGGEIRGQLSGFARPRDLVFRPLDAAAHSAATIDPKAGFYSDLKYVEETGDNVGAELLVGSIDGQRTVALMIAEGAAGPPQLGSNIVERGDTLRFAVWRDSSAPQAKAVFHDSLVEVSLSNEVGGARRLRRNFSVLGFYTQPAVGDCR